MTSLIEPLHAAYKKNFATLLRAAEDDALLLLSCADKATGEPRAVLCAHFVDDDGTEVFVPLAKLFDGNPFDEVDPPAGGEDRDFDR